MIPIAASNPFLHCCHAHTHRSNYSDQS